MVTSPRTKSTATLIKSISRHPEPNPPPSFPTAASLETTKPQPAQKTVHETLHEKGISPCLPPRRRVSVKGLPIFLALKSSRGILQCQRRPSGSSRVWKWRGRKQEAVRGELPADAELRHRPEARATSLLPRHGAAGTSTRSHRRRRHQGWCGATADFARDPPAILTC